MAFTTYFYFSKPDWKTIRYDEEINLNMDLLESALLCFPGEEPPGSLSNYPDVTPTDGMKWLDTLNHQLKMYYNGSWQILHDLIYSSP